MDIFDAAKRGDLTIVERLLETGANIDACDEAGKTALYWACDRNKLNVVGFLLDKGASTEVRGVGQRTPLITAANSNHLEVVRTLVKYHADLDAQDVYGQTAVYRAAGSGYDRVLRLLMNAGANVNLAEEDDWTPLHKAARGGHVSTVKMLVEAGVNIDAEDIDGNTPLHKAVLNDKLAVVNTLLTFNPKNTKNKDGKTALDLAKEATMTDIIEVLEMNAKSKDPNYVTGKTGELEPSQMESVDLDKSGPAISDKLTSRKRGSDDNQPTGHDRLKYPKHNEETERSDASHQMLPALPIHINPVDLKHLELDRRHRIGSGNFGMVYKGLLHGTEIAVKEIPISAREKDKLSQLILNEIRVSNLVRHPNINHFMGYALEVERRTCYLLIFLEFIEGDNLDHIITDGYLKEEYGMTDTTKRRVFLELSKAVAYLHEHHLQIIHGDIKPSNVMISKHGDVKLCDLGLSKIKQDPKLSLKTTLGLAGTPLYMAPEQLLHSKTSSTKTDMYSLGVTMFEVLYEELLRDYEDTEELKKNIEHERTPQKLSKLHSDDTVANIIKQCLKYEAVQRPRALEVVQELTLSCQ